MKPRPRSRKRRSEPETAASVMDGLMSRIGGDARAREHRVFAAYESAVGPMLRRESQAESLRGTTLFIRVSSSALAHQLTLLKGEILEQLGKTLGPNLVQDLRTRVGPLRAP